MQVKLTIILMAILVNVSVSLVQSQKPKSPIADPKKLAAIFEFPDQLIEEGRSFFLVLQVNDALDKANFTVLNDVDDNIRSGIKPMLSNAYVKMRKFYSGSGLVIPVVFLCGYHSQAPKDGSDISGNFQNMLSFFKKLNQNRLSIASVVTVIGFSKKNR